MHLSRFVTPRWKNTSYRAELHASRPIASLPKGSSLKSEDHFERDGTHRDRHGFEPPPIRIQFPLPVGTAPGTPDPKILQVLQGVRKEAIVQSVKKLASFDNRSVRGLSRRVDSGNAQAVTWLAAELEAMGYTTRTHCYRERRHGKECNVVAEKKGSGDSGEIVVVMAHLDDVGHPQAGADDNASGSAALLEMARVLKDLPSEKSIRFVLSNGEEASLNGKQGLCATAQGAG